MLLKLAALGALGYAGYRYAEKQGLISRLQPQTSPAPTNPDIRLAGGPLSSQATLQHTADAPQSQVDR
jgi:hypothetical protein